MPPRDWGTRLKDILEAIGKIQDYTAGLDRERFLLEQILSNEGDQVPDVSN